MHAIASARLYCDLGVAGPLGVQTYDGAGVMADQRSNAGKGPSWRRWLLAFVLSALALVILLRVADLDALAAAWAQIAWWPFLLVGALFFVNLAAQAWRLRILAGKTGAGPYAAWLRLAAMHQLLFALLPSGAGDLGYPILASRYVGMKVGPALRVVMVYRLQDLTALLAFAAGGLLLNERTLLATPVAVGVAVAAMAGLLVAIDIARFAALLAGAALAAAGKSISRRPWLARLHQACSEAIEAFSAPLPFTARLVTSACCLFAWCAVTASVWVLFAMIDIRLGLGEAMLVIGGLNLVGALASFTVAGLGVTEGGLAIVLVALGYSTAGAATAALIVRPLVLLNVLGVCALVEAVLRLFVSRSAATMPKDERAASPEG